MSSESTPPHLWNEARPTKWADALVWTAGFVGALAAMALMRVPRRSMGQPAANAQGGGIMPQSATDRFYRTVLGRTKRQVADVLGPPPAAAMANPSPAATPGPQAPGPQAPAGSRFWDADTWYYPFSHKEQSAVAILFDHNRAARVEFISPPQ